MGKHYLVFLCLLGIFCFPLLHCYLALAAGTDDGSEQWGYVEVRPSTSIYIYIQFLRFFSLHFYYIFWLVFLSSTTVVFLFSLRAINAEAHLFWWHYKSPYRVEDPTKPWPIILWLQGGPVSLNFKQLESKRFIFTVNYIILLILLDVSQIIVILIHCIEIRGALVLHLEIFQKQDRWTAI